MTEKDLTYQIRGAVWDVYNTLGPGSKIAVVYGSLITYNNIIENFRLQK